MEEEEGLGPTASLARADILSALQEVIKLAETKR